MVEKEERKYTIEVTEGQLRVLIASTEVMARIGIGQFWTILEHLQSKPFIKNLDIWPSARERLIRLAADMLNMPDNAGPGIFNPDVGERHKIAWDLYQVLRNALSWDREPKGGITVNFDDPLLCSGQPPARVARKVGESESDKEVVKVH